MADILKSMGGSEAMQAASYLVYASHHLNKAQEVIAKGFGDSYAALAVETNKLVRVQQQARGAEAKAHLVADPRAQTENVRKMLLAFSRDLPRRARWCASTGSRWPSAWRCRRRTRT